MGMANTSCAPHQAARSALRSKVVEIEDAQLLCLIATQRSSEAFEAFYGRYGTSAYNLARFLTGDPESAEDAVQEAMARIWRLAGTFKPNLSQNARSWTLRIVANVCTRIKQKQISRPESRAMEIELHDTPSTARSPEQDQVNAELMNVLRGVLAKLAEDDRQMVALYYGAGMTYEEIAHECAMRPRTVASRIQKALETMRARLSRMGMASAAPVLGAGTLNEALLMGHEAPARLRESVMNRLSRPGDVSTVEHSARALAAGGISGAFTAILVVATLSAIGAGFWWHTQGSSITMPGSNVTRTPAVPANEPAKAGATTPTELVHLKWNFEEGPPKDLKPAKGDWTWVPAKPGALAGMSCLQGRTFIRLPEERTLGRCWKISMRVYFINTGEPVVGAFGSREMANVPGEQFEQWSSKIVFPGKTQVVACSYLLPGWEILTYNKLSGELIGINVSKVQPESPMSGSLVCSFRSCVVQELELQEIIPEDIPGNLQDPERLIKELNLTAVGKTGVAVPPGKTVENTR